jgi:hypothetical protein
MRKLILIAAIALMSTTSCYANLSLASADGSLPATEQPKARAADVRPARVARHAETRHRRTHVWAEARYFYPTHTGCW